MIVKAKKQKKQISSEFGDVFEDISNELASLPVGKEYDFSLENLTQREVALLEYKESRNALDKSCWLTVNGYPFLLEEDLDEPGVFYLVKLKKKHRR